MTWAAAALPIVVLLILMVGLNWGGGKAGAAAWLTALAVSLLVFGGNGRLLAFASAKAILLSIWVLYIIWAALLLFHIVNEAGAVGIIGEGLLLVTENRTMQLFLLAWAFTSFLQGIAGYGVPVAVVAPLLVGLGFAPVLSVVVTSIGHSWAVSFGSLAASFLSLVGVSGLAATDLAGPAALMLGFAGYLCGASVAWAYGGPRATLRALPLIAVLGTAMGATQWFMAVHGYYSLASFTAGLVGLVVGIALARLPFYRMDRGAEPGSMRVVRGGSGRTVSLRDVAVALSPYLVLVVIVLGANVVGPVNRLLERVSLRLAFPATQTSFGWTNAATASYRSIDPFSHAGALLLYAAAIGFLIYWRAGWYQPGAPRRILARTLAGAVPSSVGIVSLVGMALIMMESGMTYQLAQGIARIGAVGFPLVSPVIGVLGCFMTGSNTNSNILFGALQRDTAHLLGLSAPIVLAAQTTGAALGGIIAPAKLIVGCSTVGLSGREGPVIRTSVRYGAVMIALVGLATLGALWIAGG